MSKQIPWPRVFVEGVVIVGSILLAFGIEAWWDGLQERDEEQELLAGLHQEIASNYELLEAALRTVEEGTRRLRAFVQMDPDGVATIHADSVVVAIYNPMRRAYATRLTTGFLEATVSSGKIALIRDQSLQSALAQFRGIDGNLQELQAILLELSVTGAVAVGRYAEPASSGVRWGEEALRALGGDREVRSVAIAKISYWLGYQAVIIALMTRLDVVMGMIDTELADAI